MKPRERNEELSVATEEAGAVAEERVGRQNLQEAEARQDAEARARRYQEFFEFAPDGHLVTDVAGTIRQANQAIAEMLGVSPRFLIGKPLVSFVAEGDRQAFRTELNRIAESSPSTDWRLRLQPRDRPEFNVAIRIGLVRDLNGPTGVQWSVRDVTDQEQGPDGGSFGGEAVFALYRDLQWVSDVWLDLANQGLDALLRNFLQRVRQVLGADTATILLVSEDGRSLDVRAAVGGQEVLANQVKVPMGRGFSGRIAAEREPIIVPDVSAIQVENPFLRTHLRSLMGVPLIVEDRVVGVLHTGSVHHRHFTSENLHLLRLVSDRAAIAIENARLYESEQRAREIAERAADRADRLQRATAALSEALTPSEVAGVIIEQSSGALGAVAAMICQTTSDRSSLRLLQAFGYPEDVLSSFATIPVDSPGPVASAARDGTAMFFESRADLGSKFPALDDLTSRLAEGGIAVVPLLLESRALGVLYLQFAHVRAFIPEDRAFLIALAQQCAQAFERARLYESERAARELAERAAGRAAVLQSVTAALSEALTPAEVAGVIVERGVLALGASAGSIGLVRDQDIEVARSVGYKEELFESWRKFPLDASVPIAEAVRSGEAIFLGSREERDARYPHLSAAALRDDQAWAAIPLIVEGNTLGAMGLSFAEPREFNEIDRGLMFALARQAAQAIQRARLYEAEQTARQQAEAAGEALSFLAEGSRVLASSLEFQPTLERVAEMAVPFLADACAIDIVSDSAGIDRAATSLSDPSNEKLLEALRQEHPDHPGHLAREVLRTGRSKLELGDSYSIMIVPLIARGRTLGAMTFAAEAGKRTYGEEHLALARDLAGRAALSIDNARLFRDQRHIATELQRSLLPPSLPPIPGVDVAGRYRAAGEGIEVGGDFFDVFEAGDDEWAVVIGDVCGKGPEAAAVTGLARHTLRAAAMHEHRPSRLLRILNDAIRNQIQDDRFCTICYARLRPNPAGIRITLSTGGHPLPLVVRGGGAPQSIGFPGTLLGVFANPDLPDHVVDLAPGDLMVLYTDGLIEGRAGSDSFGEHGLAEVLAGSGGKDAETVASLIERAVLRQGAQGLRDDLAYIVLRVVSE